MVVVCLAITLLTVTYLFVGDETLWGAWLSMAPPILWAVALVPTVFRLRSWLAATFLLGFVAMTSEFPRLGAKTQASEDTFRLVSWNIGATILAGDFNVPARMPSLAPLREFLRDAWRAAGHGWGATMPEFLPLSRIDHVWVSENIEVVSVRVRRLPGSDHRAVIVDFGLGT